MLALVAVCSCAYFNTLYNAKKKYNDAQKAEQQSGAASAAAQQVIDDDGNTVTITQARQAAPVGGNAQAYEDVIEKCKHVIARYPDSKHVDDAMLLIGKSLFALSRFDESVAALDSLTHRYPKTDLKEEADFLRGKALVRAERYDAAVAVLTEFVDHYRGSD
jgi:TolA-binding protein